MLSIVIARIYLITQALESFYPIVMLHNLLSSLGNDQISTKIAI